MTITSTFKGHGGWRRCCCFVFGMLLAISSSSSAKKTSTNRRLQEQESNNNTNWTWNNLKFITFGGSRSYGVGLTNPADSSFSALLNNANNKAIRNSTPEYSAMCLYSMVGEYHLYDVIVVEFLREHATGAMMDLGLRLRYRFPHAILIFLDYWYPDEFYYKPEGDKSFGQFYEERRMPSYDVFQPEVLDGTDEEDWGYQAYNRAVLQEAADHSNAFVLEFPEPNNKKIDSLKQYGTLYLNDMRHFNEVGHAFVRDKIVELLASLNYDSSRSRVGEFESKDHCELWYETGSMSNFQSNMEMIQFKPNNQGNTKYALEVKPGENESSGTRNAIDIFNPWGEDEAYLYVSYMATADQNYYPNALAEIMNSHSETTASYILNTTIPNGGDTEIVTNYKIGPVDPGNSVVHLRILEDTTSLTEHYGVYIVGLMLTSHQYHERIAADF